MRLGKDLNLCKSPPLLHRQRGEGCAVPLPDSESQLRRLWLFACWHRPASYHKEGFGKRLDNPKSYSHAVRHWCTSRRVRGTLLVTRAIRPDLPDGFGVWKNCSRRKPDQPQPHGMVKGFQHTAGGCGVPPSRLKGKPKQPRHGAESGPTPASRHRRRACPSGRR